MSGLVDDSITAQDRLFDPGAKVSLTLNDRFLVPPFSILDAKAGYWQSRKRDWLSLGIKSELGRDEKLLGYDSLVGNEKYGKRGNVEHTTSVFDPVLCEVAYRWFAPLGGTVLDPFAGGSVRGIVAGALQRGYLGVDLRQEQIESNYAQRTSVSRSHRLDPAPEWVCGDSRNLPAILGAHTFDAVFSCPPYYYLEQYSDDPRDLSNMLEWKDFTAAYREIIGHAVAAMKPNTFAVWVIGEVRQKVKPNYYWGLVPETIRAFEKAGAHFYNELILGTMIGTAAIRVSAQFGKGRKVGKTHQNVLVFVKGDATEAAARIPVEEVAVESGGAVWRTDGSAVVPETGEEFDPDGTTGV
jgi:hypothetical protein